ncbi:MAG TPA: insulinase family protein, partial [Spongiibacteraceae bacterium]
MKVFAVLNYRWQRIALLALFTLLSACQHVDNHVGTNASDTSNANAVIASDGDHRAYRYLQLPNQLRVLLISAPDTDKAAAALDVNIGSRQDPLQRQGLAHFLEHMLFLGTDKYPNADEYQDFIAAHGGNHNAYTAFEHTNYFFDINSAYLEPALDRFSRFFVAPLFSAEYVEREKHAVDSEYKANIQDDQHRALDVLREVVNPEHPLAKFSVGDLDTLADRPDHPVRQDLLDFYAENYSSNLMTLVVVGREPLDRLQQMVTSRFSTVPNRQRVIAPISAPLLRAGMLPELVQIQPVQQRRSLSLAWPLPDQHDDYRGKSLDYIGNILGHEGAGSLLSALKQRGWAQALSAGQGLDYDGGAEFNLSIDLTPEGNRHTDEIIGLVYRAIRLIHANGIEDWLYREQHIVADQRFRFREIPEPITEVSHLAGNLHDYPAAEVIRGDYLMEQFEADRIDALLVQLTPQNMLVTLISPDAATEKTSAYYATRYSVQSISPQRTQQWQQAAANADIKLPAPNIFITDQLALKPLSANAGDKPSLLHAGDGLQLWFLQDAVYRMPKATITIDVQAPLANNSAQHAVATELLVRVLRENLNEFSYPASLAGLNYDISRSGRGITLRVDGLDARQALLLERMLAALHQPQIDPVVFARVRREYRRQLQDNNKRPPYELLRGDIDNILVRDFWTDSELLKHIDKIEAADLQKFARQLLTQIHIDMLVYGNVVASDAQHLGALVTQQLLTSARPVTPPPVAVLHLGTHDYRRTLKSPHADAALLWYRQAADNSKSSRAALGVSAQMISADFYARLRTEQQFGYIV